LYILFKLFNNNLENVQFVPININSVIDM